MLLSVNHVDTHEHLIINNVLLYIILMCVLYIIYGNKIIHTLLVNLSNIHDKYIDIFHTKNNEFKKDINTIKSKSFDMYDSNFVLKHCCENFQNELQILKYKQLLHSKEKTSFKNK